MDQLPVEREDALDVDMPAKPEEEDFQARLDEAAIREFLSAKNLKSVRNNDSGRKSSNCFGGRMDRIGSMSTLGCNTASRFSKWAGRSFWWTCLCKVYQLAIIQSHC